MTSDKIGKKYLNGFLEERGCTDNVLWIFEKDSYVYIRFFKKASEEAKNLVKKIFENPIFL
jgi:hypothetical protein